MRTDHSFEEADGVALTPASTRQEGSAKQRYGNSPRGGHRPPGFSILPFVLECCDAAKFRRKQTLALPRPRQQTMGQRARTFCTRPISARRKAGHDNDRKIGLYNAKLSDNAESLIIGITTSVRTQSKRCRARRSEMAFAR